MVMTESSGERRASWGWGGGGGEEDSYVRRCGGEALVIVPVERGVVFLIDGGAETAALLLLR